MGLEQNRAKAVAFVKAMETGDIDLESLAPGFDCWNAAFGGLVSGETYLKGITGVAAVLKDMVMTIDGTVAEGESVAVRSHSEATLPDGKIYRNAYHFLFEFEGGRIRRVHAFLNTKTAQDDLMPYVWGDRTTFE